MTKKTITIDHNDHTITEVYSMLPDGTETLISKTFYDTVEGTCRSETYSNGVKVKVVTTYVTPDGAVIEQEHITP